MAATSTPPNLDPPFRGYIENTFDALLVFEAARRGMIPRVTRRLIERERGMVQSGAVFVFDEHESGIKRWTDGLVWSPSRILGNFLVYRETDKRLGNPPTPMSTSGPSSSSPHESPSLGKPGTGAGGPNSLYGDGALPETTPILGHGALPRPRSTSEGGGLDPQRERQLVGSLTNSYKFKESGLVKKTMSVTVNGFAQHMISYYSVEDVLRGKLRCPSTIPELASLEISADYLHKQNFRFPPMVEVGQDGVPRYRGEPEEPTSPQSPMSGIPSFPGSASSEGYDQYGQPVHSQHLHHQIEFPSQRQRSVTVPMPIPLPSPASPHTYNPPGPSSLGSSYYDQHGVSMASPIVRQHSNSSMTSTSGALRPSSSSRRYDPYGPSSSSPRMSLSSSGSIHARRQSQPIAPIPTGHANEYYAHSPTYDVKPTLASPTHSQYHYQPPATAPSAFADFGSYSDQSSNAYASQYAAWHQPGRFPSQPRDYGTAPPSSSGSSGSVGHHVPVHPHPPNITNGLAGQEIGWGPSNNLIPAAPHSAGWDPQSYSVQETPEWRGQGTGTSVG